MPLETSKKENHNEEQKMKTRNEKNSQKPEVLTPPFRFPPWLLFPDLVLSGVGGPCELEVSRLGVDVRSARFSPVQTVAM
jgi:hypothetical protein